MPGLYWPLPILIGLIVLLTGVGVFLRDPSRRLNQLLLLETIVIFLWAVTNSFVIFYWDTLPLRIFWDHWTYATGFLMASLFSVFSFYLPVEKAPSKQYIWFSIGVSALFASIVFLPDLFPVEIATHTAANKIYLSFYSLFFIFFVFHGIRTVWKKMRAAKNPLEKKQLNIMATGLCMTFALGIAAGIFAPILAINSYTTNLVTVFSTLIFTAFAGYAVAKYGFMASLKYAMNEIFRSFHAGIMITDSSGKIVRMNPMLLNLIGAETSSENGTVRDFVARLTGNLEPQQASPVFQTWFLEEKDGEREFAFEGNIKKALIISKKRIEDSHGFSAGWIYMFLDDTERKRLTRELRESHDHLEGLLENANDAIITCDRTGTIMSANKMATQFSGLRQGQWRGRSIFEFIAPEHVAQARSQAASRLLRKESSGVFQLDLLTSESGKIPVETSLNTIESNGEIIGLQAIARDLRPRLQAESQIRELQEINEQIIQNAQTGILTMDKNGNFITANPALASILGFESPADLIGKNFFDFPGVKQFSLADLLNRVLAGETIEQTFNFRTVLTNKQVNIKAFGTPLTSEKGEAHGALIIVADLAREKELERQLIQSEKLSSLGKLISGVAHELNNPLTAIMGYAQFLLLDDTLPEKPHQMVGKIQASAERCRKIVANLLGYVKITPPEKCEIDIHELLDKTLELREHDFRMKNVTIQKRYHPNLPTTAGDPNQLQQVFLNLINNAFDAMHEKNGFSGHLEIATYQSPDNFISIEFIDNGPGIEESIRNKIFDPFFTTKAVGKGTGLGLSLSSGIMRAHGGLIVLDTSYQAGAKFVLKIPIEAAPRPKVPEEDEKTNLPQHVLLVDDEEQILECTKMLLENNHYQVTTASNGEQARSKISEQRFDLIVTDLRMPGSIDGKALYALVQKEMPRLADKMVFITGDVLDAETHNFLSSVPNRHVKKPFTTCELIDALVKTSEPSPSLLQSL